MISICSLPEGRWGGYKFSGIGSELSHFGLDGLAYMKQFWIRRMG